MAETLAIGAADGARVAASAVVIVAALLLLLRLLGQRSVARMTTFDVAVLLVLGAAGGRVITGHTPTLAAGLVAIIVLISLRALADRLARTRLGARIIRNRPILLVDGDQILAANLAKARVSDEQLWEALRSAGVCNLEEVAYVVFETTGSVSVIRMGASVDPRLLEHVRR